MTPSRSKWRRTTRKMKMAKMGKTSWYPISLIHLCMGIHKKLFTRRALGCCSWRLNGRRIFLALQVWRFEIKWFYLKSRGRLCSFWTLFNGVYHWNLRVVRSSQCQSTVQITTTIRRLKTSRIRWDGNFQREKCQNVIQVCAKFSTQIAQDIRTLHDTLCRFKSILVDPAEFACLKAIVLFRSEAKGLKDSTQIENLQDQAQVIDMRTNASVSWCVKYNPQLLI